MVMGKIRPTDPAHKHRKLILFYLKYIYIIISETLCLEISHFNWLGQPQQNLRTSSENVIED